MGGTASACTVDPLPVPASLAGSCARALSECHSRAWLVIGEVNTSMKKVNWLPRGLEKNNGW